MNIVARLKTIDEVPFLAEIGTDIIMLDTIALTTKAVFPMEKPMFKDALSTIKEHNMKVYAYLNKMIHETDLFELESWLSFLKEINIDGIVINDFTVYVMAEKLGLQNKIIYQPGTMNTNSFDAQYLSGRIKGMTLSKEITFDEIDAIVKSTKEIEFSILGHGFIDMFYSKRKLLTNYYLHKNLTSNHIQNNFNYVLEEKTRSNERYPIFEDKEGTHIFRDKKLNSFTELQFLDLYIKDFFIERIFIDDQEYFDSIKAYKSPEMAVKFVEKYKGSYNSGFYYLPTEKTKGDRHED